MFTWRQTALLVVMLIVLAGSSWAAFGTIGGSCALVLVLVAVARTGYVLDKSLKTTVDFVLCMLTVTAIHLCYFVSFRRVSVRGRLLALRVVCIS